MEDSNKHMFLTPQDLRIGNYINYENTTHVVAELHKEKLIHYWISSGSDGYVTSYNQILSIPVCPKELEKFGFEEDEDRLNVGFIVMGYSKIYFHENEKVCIVYDEKHDVFLFCINKEDEEFITIKEIDFVHELQNAYFFITNKELKFN